MGKIISREDIINTYKDHNYTEILSRESHHDHEIVMIDGVLRWKQNDSIREYVNKNSLNDLIPFLESLGINKNSEEYRKMYRGMGYSLSGYWEVFYWLPNNEKCDEYRNTVVEKG